MKNKPIIIVSGEPYSVFLEIFFKVFKTNLYKNYNYNYKDIFNILKQHEFTICTVFTPNILTVLPDDFEPKVGDYIAIKNIDEFLERSNYKLSD